MQTKEEIREGNQLIAEFMKYEQGYPHKTDKYGYHQCEDGFHIPEHINYDRHDEDLTPHEFLIGQLKFDTSFDWLMPVVERISKIPCDDQPDPEQGIDTFYPRTFGMLNKEGEYMFRFNRFGLFSAPTLIEATYQAVVEFIKSQDA